MSITRDMYWMVRELLKVVNVKEAEKTKLAVLREKLEQLVRKFEFEEEARLQDKEAEVERFVEEMKRRKG